MFNVSYHWSAGSSGVSAYILQRVVFE